MLQPNDFAPLWVADAFSPSVSATEWARTIVADVQAAKEVAAMADPEFLRPGGPTPVRRKRTLGVFRW